MSPDNRKRVQAGPSTSFGDVTNGATPDQKRNRRQTPQTSEDVNYTNKIHIKKRKRDSSSPESNSFVSAVKSKVTNLLQASFSKWFSSPTSSKSNGSVPMVDITDSSTDDEREADTPIVTNSPPAKRKKYSSYGKIEANCLVQRNRADTSVPYRNKSSQPSDDEVVERSEQSNLQLKRHLPFHCDDRSVKSSPSQNSRIDLKQPSFKQALVGSLFYPGRTSYGGAVSQYVNQPNITERKDTHVTEVNNSDSMNISHSSRRVMELLDQYSSPRRDALRIPQYDRTLHRNSSSVNSSALSLNKTRELHVPSILSLLRLKRRSRLMDTTNTARQIIASQSSSPSDSNYTSAPYSNQREHRQLHTSSITQSSSARLVEDMSSIIAPEYVPSSSPPKVLKFQPATNISINLKSSSSNNDYKFSSPAKVSSGSPVPVSTPLLYTFGRPDSEVDMNKRNDGIIVPAKDTEIGINKPKDWQCPDCWVINNDIKCPCCGAQKPFNAENKNAKCIICKQSYRQSCSDKCITCEKIPASIGHLSPVSTTYNYGISNPLSTNKDKSKWTCKDCLVANEASAKKCVCCGAKTTQSTQKNELQNEWTCNQCSIKNKISLDKCTGCGANRLAGKKPALPTNSFSTPISAVDSKVQTIIDKQNEKWECQSCMVRNDSNKLKCVCCNTEKPGAVKQIKNAFNFGTSTVDSKVQNIVNEQNAKWECGSCMVRNDNNIMKCVCCDTEKPRAVKQIKNTFNFGTSTTSIADSKVQNIVNKQNEKWECGSCMVRNDNIAIKCAFCDAERPAAVHQIKNTFNFGTTTTSVADSKVKNIVNKQNEKWECGSCMVRNDDDKMNCVCCDTERPEPKKPIKNTFTFGINTTNAINNKVQSIVDKQKDKWECSNCLVRNDSNKMKCICCETEKAGTVTSMKSTFNFGMTTPSKFKFGIDPKEQENNQQKSTLEKKDLPEESETNNNILPKLLPFGVSGKTSGDQTDSSITDKKNDVTPEIAFSFGIRKSISSAKPIERTVDNTKEESQLLPKGGVTTLETKPVANSLSGMFSLKPKTNTEKTSVLPAAAPPTLPATLPLTLSASVPTSLSVTSPVALSTVPPSTQPTLSTAITVKTPKVLGTTSPKKSFSFSERGTGLTNLFAKSDEPSPAPLSLFSRNEQTTNTNIFEKPATTIAASVPTVPAVNPVFTFDSNAKPIAPSLHAESKLSFNFGTTTKSDSSNSFTFKFGSTADNAGSKGFSLPSGPSVNANNPLSGNVVSAGNGLPSGNGDGNLAPATEQPHNPLESSNIFRTPQKDNIWSPPSFSTSAPNLFGTNNNASNLPKPVFSFGSSSTQFNNSTPVFGTSVQPTQNLFGMSNQNASTPQQSLFSSPAQNQPASNIFGSTQPANVPETQLGMFGPSNVGSGSTFGATQSTPIAPPSGGAFNFGASQSVGVFGFGQASSVYQPQQPQQQPYNFGTAATGSPQVQFNMGNMATAGARRVRKAVRRNPR